MKKTIAMLACAAALTATAYASPQTDFTNKIFYIGGQNYEKNNRNAGLCSCTYRNRVCITADRLHK